MSLLAGNGRPDGGLANLERVANGETVTECWLMGRSRIEVTAWSGAFTRTRPLRPTIDGVPPSAGRRVLTRLPVARGGAYTYGVSSRPIMIVEQGLSPDPASRVWLLQANRAMGIRGLTAFFILMASASLTVALLSYRVGNAYAPLFAVAELAALAWCLRLVWRRLSACELLRLDPAELRLQAATGEHRFHAGWVRVCLGMDKRLRLRSHGREVEVGRFLPEQEREALAASVNQALARLRTH